MRPQLAATMGSESFECDAFSINPMAGWSQSDDAEPNGRLGEEGFDHDSEVNSVL